MSWVDVVIIALVVLLGTIGVFKGTKRSALALGAFVVAFILAFVLTNVIAELLLSVPAINKFVLGSSGFSLYNWIHSGLAPDSASSFIAENFYKPIQEIVNSSTLIEKGFYSGGFTADQGMALYLAYCVFAAIVGVGLFIVIRLLLTIITVIVKSYFTKKKSVAGRLCGFLVGVVRGAAWTLAITVVFTTLGGLNFVGGLNKMETEYEDSVIGTLFNSMAYSIKNSMFLPDEDAYQRIVELSGIRGVDEGDDSVDDEEEDETPDNSENLALRRELYCDVMNLNYYDTAYSIDEDTGEIKYDSYAERINADDFTTSEMDGVLQAILDYNIRMGEALLDDDGAFASLDAATLQEYINIVQSGNKSVYDLWNNIFYVLIHNYDLDAQDGKTFTNAELIASTQASLQSQYDIIVNALDELVETYAKIPEFAALELVYPGCVKL